MGPLLPCRLAPTSMSRSAYWRAKMALTSARELVTVPDHGGTTTRTRDARTGPMSRFAIGSGSLSYYKRGRSGP